MSFAPPFARIFRSFAPLLVIIAGLPAFAQSCTTTIAGKVYSPLGPTAGDPIPNILVYVATTPVSALPQGLTSCAGESQLVTGNPLVSTNTAADGSFSLTNVGLNTIANPVNVVIQAGKWRRQNSVTITPCTTNTFNFTMPANKSQGDLPRIAVVTGEADGVECIFRKIGISDSEFTDPGAGGSINLYEGTGTKTSGGAVVNPADNPVPSEASLVESQTTLNSYDLVMFGCQGTPTDTIASADTGSALENLVSYANTGGRIFSTHYGYVWLDNIQPFKSSANWIADKGTITEAGFASGTGVATIDTTYPEGAVLANWLQNIGASYNGQYGQMQLQNMRQDQNAVYNPPAQTWLNLNDPSPGTNYTGNPSMQFTFDTPVNSTTTPTVALTFANSPKIFHPSDTGDDVTINVADTSTTTPADNSLTMTLLLPSGVTATSLAGANAGTGWICAVNTLTCNRTTALAAATTDPVLLVLSVAANAPLGDATITASITGGGLSGTNQCGRVLYNDYHVENGATTGEQYPKECSSASPTPQEKFLEFSLYNLSNFVAPVTSDIIDIQAYTTLTWPTPASIPYGTALSATQLDASVTVTASGVTVPGTYVYSPAAGTILDAGTQTLNVTFTPTDPTSYAPASGSVQLLVTQDTTGTTLGSSVNPSVINQSVTFTATVTGSNAAPTGNVSFYDGAMLIGTGTLAATTTANVSTATFSTSILTLGPHNITAVYANTLDFGPSTSGILVQVVNLIPSATTITGIVSPIYYGQIIGDTAFVNVAGFSAGGTTAVYIDNVLVCTLPVIAGQTSTCPPSTGAGYNAGVHTIYAVYSGDPEYATSTSPVYSVTILPDNTTTTVISSQNPSKQGQSVTFTATVGAPYAAPVGTVNFYVNGVLLAAANLNAAGAASVTSTLLPTGPDNITATYVPSNNNFNPSTSAVLQQQVNPLIPRFEITITPDPLNIAVNSTGTATITVTDYDGFNQPVTLTCSGITTETVCNFAQLLTPAGGGSTTVTLTPAPPHNCNVTQAENSSPRGPATWLALVGLALLLTRRRRRLFQAIALAALLIGLLPVVSGCGNCTDLGVLPGSYTVTITGTSTGTPVQTSSATVTMNVQY